MSTDTILALLPAFTMFLDSFRGCFPRQDTFDHLLTYGRGLLSGLPRKSVEPIALASGTAVRTLQCFLASAKWDHAQLRDLIQQRVAARSGEPADDLGRIGIIDETSDDKKGTQTPGVQRQWLGRLGKTDNGIVTVHLALAQGRFKTLLDADLFLPENWDADRERCQAAGIPDTLRHRPKTHIALEQLARAKANGLALDWLTFDEGYGKSPHFLREVENQGLVYVGEVPKSFRCATARDAEVCQAQNLLRHSRHFRSQGWATLTLKRQTVAPQIWHCKALHVFLKTADGTLSERRYWLLVGYQPQTGEYKYWVSNAPLDTPLEKLARVAFSRWNVEHAFRIAKSEVGFSHFEGRCYTGLMRHLILCLMVLLFVAEETAAQAAFSPGGHDGAGGEGLEYAVPTFARRKPEPILH